MQNKFITILVLSTLVHTMADAKPRSIEVHGHRGARAARAENTLAAFEYALQVGVDVIELDIAVTKDNALVVSHDPVIDPTLCLGPNGQAISKAIPIRSMTLRQIKGFDCGSLKNPRFPNQILTPGGQKIPTLEEVFDLARNSKEPAAEKVQFNIETKITPGLPKLSPKPRRFSRLLVREIKKHGMEDRTIIQSFDHRTLHAVKRFSRKIKIAALISSNLPNLPLIARNLGAQIISPKLGWFTPRTVRSLQRRNIKNHSVDGECTPTLGSTDSNGCRRNHYRRPWRTH